MEESIKPVDSQTPPPAAVEIMPAVSPSPAAPANFTKVDNNLTGIGFFTASSKRSRKAVEKTTIVVDGGVERRISILPSAKYGLPITQDQDFWLALMQLVEDRRRQEGTITNPFTFSTAELIKILGQSDAGKNYKAVEEWLAVMTSTTIEGGAYNIVKKSWMTKRTHAVETTVTVGKELPDGKIAEKNHIWFSQWQLDNINSGNLIAIELTTYTQLENNISKNLVPYLQEWLYASQRDGRFEKQYEDVCQLLGIRTYRYLSDIQRKFGPSLDELTTHGYLSKWAIELMADRKTYKLVLWHGPKYHTDRQTRLDKNPNRKVSAGEPTQRRPRQQRLHLAATSQPEPDQKQQPTPVIIHWQHVAELTKRGIGESKAREMVATLPKEFPLLDTLEWGDVQISQAAGSRTEIKNPPGFYIHLLEQRVIPPPSFETTRARKARQEAEFAKLEAIRKQQEAELAAEAAETAMLQAQLEALPEADRLALFAEVKAEAPKQMSHWLTTADPEVSSFFQAGARKKLKNGWRSPQSATAQTSTTETQQQPQGENLYQAMNRAVGQDPRLQTFAEILHAILTTPQLRAAVKKTLMEQDMEQAPEPKGN